MDKISITNIKMMGFDIETYDPNLTTKGNGVYRKDGYILGVSIAIQYDNGDLKSWYFNTGHTNVTDEIKEQSWKMVKLLLAIPCPKVGANILYDLDWLENFQGVPVAGPFHDVQVAEPLINEHRFTYKLDALAKSYLGEQKEETEIKDYCLLHGFPISKSKPVQCYLYKMPSFIVEPYAKIDAELPIKIIDKQLLEIDSQNLNRVYKLEMELQKLLLQMRKCGAPVDVDYINETKECLKKQSFTTYQKLVSIFPGINFNSSKQLAGLFDSLGLPYPLTPKKEKVNKAGVKYTSGGNPSIDAKVLAACENKDIREISKYKQYTKCLNDFFITSFTDCRVNGRIHCQFNQLKSDENGTITGRFSSSSPNLQNIPARHPELGPLTRRAFIPEKNHLLIKIDWSQIEYRILGHYAVGEGADEIRHKYNNDKKTDYHLQVMELTGLERKPAKAVNLGCGYGMGIAKMAEYNNWSLSYATEIMTTYHERVPFVRSTMNAISNVAKERGFVMTILKRRARLQDKNKAYKMMNSVMQGTAADIMKLAMVQAHREGVFKILIPHLTVHDELVVSMPITPEGVAGACKLKYIMENCIKLKVPIIADMEIGKNWADLTAVETEQDINNYIKDIKLDSKT